MTPQQPTGAVAPLPPHPHPTPPPPPPPLDDGGIPSLAATTDLVHPEDVGWSAWEQKEFLTANRNWQAVSDFYAALVRGDTSLSALGLKEPRVFNLAVPGTSLGRPAAGRGAAASPAPVGPSERDQGNPGQPGTGPAEGPQGGGAGPHSAPAEGPQAGGAGPHSAPAGVRDGAPRAAGDGGGTTDGGGGRAGGRVRCRGGSRQRLTYKVAVNYFGGAFAGWAYQPGRVTLQGTLETILQPLVGEDASRVVVVSAGRTDAGVHANGMPFSFYTWQPLEPEDVMRTVDSAHPGQLRTLSVEERPRHFHATFSATWRRYVYLFPLRPCPTQASSSSSNCLGSSGGAAASDPDDGAAAPLTAAASSTPHSPQTERMGVTACAPAAAAGAAAVAAAAAAAVAAAVAAAAAAAVAAAAAAAAPAAGTSGAASCPPQICFGSSTAAAPHPVASSSSSSSCGGGGGSSGGYGGGCGGSHRPVIPPEVYLLDPDPELLGRMLASLEGCSLDYIACARDTPQGKDGMCTLHLCRSSVVVLPPITPPPLGQGTPRHAKKAAAAGDAAAGGSGGAAAPPPAPWSAQQHDGPAGAADSPPGAPVRVLCVELAGDRFLRKMVRVLVSTGLREATAGAGRGGGRDGALLECLRGGRGATAMPAPAMGLCFAGAGYEGGSGAAARGMEG